MHLKAIAIGHQAYNQVKKDPAGLRATTVKNHNQLVEQAVHADERLQVSLRHANAGHSNREETDRGYHKTLFKAI